MSYLNLEQIISADDIQYKEIEVPEWGGVIRLKRLTEVERSQVIKYKIEHTSGNGAAGPGKYLIRAYELSMSIVDDKGKRVFTDSKVAQLGAKCGSVIDRLYFENFKFQDPTFPAELSKLEKQEEKINLLHAKINDLEESFSKLMGFVEKINTAVEVETD